jgi:hypothetical protein
MKRILITGSAGAIGQILRAGLAGVYRSLRLADGGEFCALEFSGDVKSMFSSSKNLTPLGPHPDASPGDAGRRYLVVHMWVVTRLLKVQQAR